MKFISAPCLPTLDNYDTVIGNPSIRRMVTDNARSRPLAAVRDMSSMIAPRFAI